MMSLMRSGALLQMLFVLTTLSMPQALAGDGAVEGAAVGKDIVLWTRVPGLHSEGRDPGKGKVKVVNLDKLSKQKVMLTDLQYDGKFEFRAVNLTKIIKSYAPGPSVDRILLHFKNGMIIPLPLEDDFTSLKKVNAWIATAWKSSKNGAWSPSFEDIGRIDERFRDPAPVTFGFNKLVVKHKWHPYVSDPVFSPFNHADTLTGIEFVNGAAYDRQFVSPSDLAGLQGWEVFSSRCQYCHGLNKTGATHGWDFLNPVPIFQLRTAQNLYYRVKYTYHNAMMMGMQMPKQESVDLKEVTDLRNWLKGFTKKKIQPYRP